MTCILDRHVFQGGILIIVQSKVELLSYFDYSLREDVND